jgi:hypothetical protein
VITALGSLVEPLVKRNLAMLSGPVAAKAASASLQASTPSRLANEWHSRPATSPAVSSKGVAAGSTVSMARAKA